MSISFFLDLMSYFLLYYPVILICWTSIASNADIKSGLKQHGQAIWTRSRP